MILDAMERTVKAGNLYQFRQSSKEKILYFCPVLSENLIYNFPGNDIIMFVKNEVLTEKIKII